MILAIVVRCNFLWARPFETRIFNSYIFLSRLNEKFRTEVADRFLPDGGVVTFTIVLLALVAAFLGLRLYSVLGKRTGHEQEPVAHRPLEANTAALLRQPAAGGDAA